jgi:hypothetical protein
MEKKVPNGRMSLKYIFAAPLLALAFFSCQDPAGEPAEDQPEQVVQVPHFNSDSAYAFVKAQVDFGPRVPGTAAHQRCGDYLAQKLSSYRLSVTEQKAPATTYDGKKYTLRNIIGSYKPELGNRILLVAHWDTRPFADRDDVNNTKPADGANDGASGAGVLLEIARLSCSPTLKITDSRKAVAFLTRKIPGAWAPSTGPVILTSPAITPASASFSTWWEARSLYFPVRATPCVSQATSWTKYGALQPGWAIQGILCRRLQPV